MAIFLQSIFILASGKPFRADFRRNKMKKILVIALAALMLVSIASCSSENQGDLTSINDYVAPSYTYQPSVSDKTYTGHKDSVFTFSEGVGDSAIITGYSGPYAPHDIVVPATIGERTVTGIGEKAFYYCTSMLSVTIPETVTVIDDNAFTGCNSLVEVTIPSEVSEIANSAFLGCTALTKVTFKGTAVKAIGDYAFYGCTALSEITLPAGLKTIGSAAFWGCESIESVVMPESVKTIGKMAYYFCSSLNHEGGIVLTAGITEIGDYAFSSTNKNYIVAPEGSYAEKYVSKMTEKEFEEQTEADGDNTEA